MHHHPHAGIVYIVYGLIVLGGGIYGYVKAKSSPSLVAGVVSALITFAAAALFRGHHPRIGIVLGGLVGLALSIVFYRRYQETKNAMPAIPIGILSLLVILYSIWAFMRVNALRLHGG